MVPFSRSLLDGLPKSPNGAAARQTIADQCQVVLVTNQRGESFSFGEQLVWNRAVIVHSVAMDGSAETEEACSKLQALRPCLGEIFDDRQVSLVTATLEGNVSITEQLQPLAARFGATEPLSGPCEWHFVTSSAESLATLRRIMGSFETNPYVNRNVLANRGMLVFGNGRADRWAALPLGVSLSLLLQSIRRVCSFTYRQRYS